MLRVGWQAGIMHAGNLRVGLQETRNLHGALLVPLQADRKSPQTTKHKPRSKRVQYASQRGAFLYRKRTDKLLAPHHHSGHDIAMSAKVLGSRMQHQVDPEIGGVLEIGR